MTPEIAWCFEDQTPADAERVMTERQIRRLPVLDRDKRLVGIVSLGDLAIKTGEPKAIGKTLEKVSEPEEKRCPPFACKTDVYKAATPTVIRCHHRRVDVRRTTRAGP
jgi:CBS-domain-containing membrane protein